MVLWISFRLRENLAFHALSSATFPRLSCSGSQNVVFILSECCMEITECISQWQVKELGVLIQTEQCPQFWWPPTPQVLTS